MSYGVMTVVQDFPYIRMCEDERLVFCFCNNYHSFLKGNKIATAQRFQSKNNNHFDLYIVKQINIKS